MGESPRARAKKRIKAWRRRAAVAASERSRIALQRKIHRERDRLKVGNMIDHYHAPGEPPRGYVYVLEAEKAGVPLDLMLAQIDTKESPGFRNIFGCDFGNREEVPYCNQKVTKDSARKLLIWAERTHSGNGVGPMQLTYYTYLREAERQGGLHKVSAQLKVAFKIMHDLIQSYGDREALARYNGGNSPPASSYAYANAILAERRKWRRRIKRALK